MRWITLVLLLLLVLLSVHPAAVRAQEDEEEFSSPWRTSYFPFITGRSNDGPLIGAQIRYWQPAPYEARTTFTGAFNADAGLTPNGTRYARAEFEAPLLWNAWRLTASALASREARFGYFGLGNNTAYDRALVTTSQPFLYRVRRTRYVGRAEVSRYLRSGGPILVALLGSVESNHFSSLPGPSVFDIDFGTASIEDDDVSARLALVYDTRDNEYNTQQGLLLEAGAQVGSGGDNYTRLYTVLRAYVRPRESTVVAARVAASGMGGTPPLDARFTIPSWEHTIPVIGGEFSHRALDTGRLAGKHVFFGNFELRQDLLNFGDLGAITILGFVDAGRVFEGEPFELTTADLKVGGGGGIGLRILRSTIFTFNFAGGPDGFNFSVANGWMF